jgi:putative transport protein
MHFMQLLRADAFIENGLAILSLAVTLGLAIGAVRIGGLKLGIAGVLFSALLFGQIGLSVDPQVLDFLRDFSLILFVYTIGLQVGPGFVDSLKAEGLRLNLLTVAVLVLGALMTGVIVALAHLDRSGASGLYSGAFTTTPGLAAGQEVLKHSFSGDAALAAARSAGLAYAVTYPFGVIGPVLVIAIMRRLFKVDIEKEKQDLAAANEVRRPPVTYLDIEVTNPDIIGLSLNELEFARKHRIIFSRMMRDGVMSVPNAGTFIAVGDILRAIAPKAVLEQLAQQIGHPSDIDLGTVSSDISRLDLVVTRTQVLRKTLRELDLIKRHGVTITKVTRAGVDLLPTANLALHFADTVTVVGPPSGLKAAEAELGNCLDVLNRPQLVPIFLGIVLGIVVGTIPLRIPGINGSLSLGLAAGPMLVAIALSRFGNIGRVVWYMPAAANTLFRDFGLAVFLACVGLQQGNQFIQKLLSGNGLSLVFWGAFLTMVPVLIVGIAARRFYKMNFLTLSGWVSGAMTSSPALLFASESTGSDAPALAYAAIAPVGFIVPIFCCQFLASILR